MGTEEVEKRSNGRQGPDLTTAGLIMSLNFNLCLLGSHWRTLTTSSGLCFFFFFLITLTNMEGIKLKEGTSRMKLLQSPRLEGSH